MAFFNYLVEVYVELHDQAVLNLITWGGVLKGKAIMMNLDVDSIFNTDSRLVDLLPPVRWVLVKPCSKNLAWFGEKFRKYHEKDGNCRRMKNTGNV